MGGGGAGSPVPFPPQKPRQFTSKVDSPRKAVPTKPKAVKKKPETVKKQPEDDKAATLLQARQRGRNAKKSVAERRAEKAAKEEEIRQQNLVCYPRGREESRRRRGVVSWGVTSLRTTPGRRDNAAARRAASRRRVGNATVASTPRHRVASTPRLDRVVAQAMKKKLKETKAASEMGLSAETLAARRAGDADRRSKLGDRG